jgi:glycosyltransferase involved in cell wall biosynthesis
MNVLILHNLYQQPGGEETVVRNEAALLERAGHAVTVETADNDDIRGLAGKVRTTLRMAHDPARRRWMNGLIDRMRPDVVHVHNFFPLLTSAVHAAAQARGIPVVQTLHNYRLFCAAATFERDGQVCELCLQGSRLNAVRYRCYRGSALGSAAMAAMQRRLIDRGLLTDNVDRFIALTEFARGKYVEGGLPAGKLALKPNFLDRPERPPAAARSGVLFVGRLSHEKGVDRLVKAWRDLPHVPLTIAGDGPLRTELENAASANTTFLGRVPPERVEAEMQRASALIVPSIWYEGFPMTLAESFANGLPAIVSRIGSLAEIVEPGVTGAHCFPGDEQSIVETVARVFADEDALRQMSSNARDVFEREYSAERNLAMLEAIYAEAAAARQNRHQPQVS